MCSFLWLSIEWVHFHFSLSCIGEGNGKPLQCSCLENLRDGGAWWAAIYGVAQGWTWLEKAMAPHSSTLAWKIPWMEEPGRLQSIGSRRVRHDWTTSPSLFTFLPGESQGWGWSGGGASWAAISGVAQSQTRLKWLSSSRSNLAAVAAAVFHYTMMYHSFFIHSFVNGYLGCFLVLAIVNGAAMNFGLRVSFSVLVSSRYMPRSGVARSYGVFLFSPFMDHCLVVVNGLA